MLGAVLDTNVVVSAAIKPSGRQAQILQMALSGVFRFFVSEALLQEYEGVLRRPRFGLTPGKVSGLLREIRSVAVLTRPQEELRVARDPADDKVLACAVAAHADYLVTGNLRDFPDHFRGTTVVSPQQFQTILAGSLES